MKYYPVLKFDGIDIQIHLLIYKNVCYIWKVKGVNYNRIYIENSIFCKRKLHMYKNTYKSLTCTHT